MVVLGQAVCPLSGVRRCPLLGGSKCTIYIVRSIRGGGGTRFVRCLEVVRFSECVPLSFQGPLCHINICIVLYCRERNKIIMFSVKSDRPNLAHKKYNA